MMWKFLKLVYMNSKMYYLNINMCILGRGKLTFRAGLWLGPWTKLICSVCKGLYVNAVTVVVWIQTLIWIRVVSFEYLGLFHVFLYTCHTWRSSHSWSWRQFIRLIHYLCKCTVSSLNMHSHCSCSFQHKNNNSLLQTEWQRSVQYLFSR